MRKNRDTVALNVGRGEGGGGEKSSREGGNTSLAQTALNEGLAYRGTSINIYKIITPFLSFSRPYKDNIKSFYNAKSIGIGSFWIPAGFLIKFDRHYCIE